MRLIVFGLSCISEMLLTGTNMFKDTKSLFLALSTVSLAGVVYVSPTKLAPTGRQSRLSAGIGSESWYYIVINYVYMCEMMRWHEHSPSEMRLGLLCSDERVWSHSHHQLFDVWHYKFCLFFWITLHWHFPDEIEQIVPQSIQIWISSNLQFTKFSAEDEFNDLCFDFGLELDEVVSCGFFFRTFKFPPGKFSSDILTLQPKEHLAINWSYKWLCL